MPAGFGTFLFRHIGWLKLPSLPNDEVTTHTSAPSGHWCRMYVSNGTSVSVIAGKYNLKVPVYPFEDFMLRTTAGLVCVAQLRNYACRFEASSSIMVRSE
jgi:hypothetical protein